MGLLLQMLDLIPGPVGDALLRSPLPDRPVIAAFRRVVPRAEYGARPVRRVLTLQLGDNPTADLACGLGSMQLGIHGRRPTCGTRRTWATPTGCGW